MGSQRVGHDWATELNWTKAKQNLLLKSFLFLNMPTGRFWITYVVNILFLLDGADLETITLYDSPFTIN